MAVQSHIFIQFQGFSSIPELFHRAVFPILSPSEEPLSVQLFFQPRGENPAHLSNIKASGSRNGTNFLVLKYFYFGLNYHINPQVSNSNKSYLFSFRGKTCAKSIIRVRVDLFLKFTLTSLSLCKDMRSKKGQTKHETISVHCSDSYFPSAEGNDAGSLFLRCRRDGKPTSSHNRDDYQQRV